jgi:hypothetical protein
VRSELANNRSQKSRTKSTTSGNTPGHVGYDACLAIDYLDFTAPARRTR